MCASYPFCVAVLFYVLTLLLFVGVSFSCACLLRCIPFCCVCVAVAVVFELEVCFFLSMLDVVFLVLMFCGCMRSLLFVCVGEYVLCFVLFCMCW